MDRSLVKKTLYVAGILLGIWLGVKYLLPVLLPFLLGALLAFAAEPLVQLADHRLKLRRLFASGVGVTLTLALLVAFGVLLGSLAVKELTMLTHRLPDVRAAAGQSMEQLRSWMHTVVSSSPESVRGLLMQTVDDSLKDGTALVNQVTERIPGALTSAVGWLSKGTLAVFTAVLSAYMISVRLPKLRTLVQSKLPDSWHEKYLPTLQHLRRGLWGWLKAQLKLMVLTWGIVGLGLTILGVDYGVLWAGLIALVDAVPVLGTGTVLIPWALISFLQSRVVFGVGLLGVYAVALITRTVLEPRLIGRQLGLDPLVTLVAFYAGFALWGFVGMLLAPILAAAIGTALKQKAV